jgi:16S rRNA (guanine527-N7)-methyltransferase
VDSPEILSQYFHLTDLQRTQFQNLQNLYTDWNQKVNLISRKDIDNLYERHVLHSLAIAKVLEFNPQTHILDLGTGGGFPGIPLAIFFPECRFHLIDSIGKKIRAVEEIIFSLGIKNCYATHLRAEHIKESSHFVVSRAVTEIPKMIKWIGKKISSKSSHHLPNGLFCLKGDDVKTELKNIRQSCQVFPIKKFFREEFFEKKVVVHVEMDI